MLKMSHAVGEHHLMPARNRVKYRRPSEKSSSSAERNIKKTCRAPSQNTNDERYSSLDGGKPKFIWRWPEINQSALGNG